MPRKKKNAALSRTGLPGRAQKGPAYFIGRPWATEGFFFSPLLGGAVQSFWSSVSDGTTTASSPRRTE